jgi:ABC-type Fe3+ transport system substrate-binding protein
VTTAILLLVEAALGAVVGVLGALLWKRRARPPLPLVLAFVVTLAAAVVPATVLGPQLDGAPRRVRVVSVLDDATTEALVQAFTRRTGILCEVDPFAGGTQTTAQLILQGRIHPDVLLGGTVEIHEELARAGRLLPSPPAPDEERIDRYDDPEGMWTPLYLGLLGLVYRPLPELSAHEPDWLTLLQPRFRGRISIPAPDKTGGGLVFLATQMLRHEDPEKAWEYFQLLDQNEVRWEDRSSLPITRCAAGTMDLGVAWAHDVLRRIEAERLPVKVAIPAEPGLEVGAASILADARDLYAARRFLTFLAGQEAGAIQASVGRRVPLRQDVDPPGYLARGALEEAVPRYDRSRVMENREAWIERWRRERGTQP